MELILNNRQELRQQILVQSVTEDLLMELLSNDILDEEDLLLLNHSTEL
jgi:hypothetical protein